MTNLEKFEEVFGFKLEPVSVGFNEYPWIVPCAFYECSSCPINVLGVSDDEEDKDIYNCSDSWWLSEYKGE